MLPIPSIEIDSHTQSWIAGGVFAIAAILGYFYYRRTIPPIPRFTRLLLSILRALAVGMILFLLLDPILHVVFVARRPPTIAVLADRSASMSIIDKAGSRSDEIHSLLTTDLPPIIPRRAEVKYYTFGTSLRGPFSAPSDSIGDETTDIAGGIRELTHERNRENICAVILISDGVYTVGENPIHESEQLDLPMFTIGVGDTTEQKDILVSRVSTNDVVYAGTKIPVDVSIKSTGFGGQQTEVTLLDGTHVLDRTSVSLPDGTAEVGAQLSYTPQGEGVHHYSIRVASMPGELTLANNQRSFSVRILRSTMRVLIVASSPGPDLSMIRQVLAEDKNISLRVRTQRYQGGYYGAPLGASDIDSSDCIVTIGMPSAATTVSTIALLGGAVTDRRRPMFIVGGRDLDYTRLLAMAPSCPLSVVATSPMEEELEFSLEPGHADHPLLAPGPSIGTEVWNHLPPVFATQSTYQPREGATVLGYLKRHDSAHPQAILALRNLGGVKSLAFMGYGIWRWRLLTQTNQESASLMTSFLPAVVRWLTSQSEGKVVRISPIKDQFSSGEPIGFTAQVYNENMQPMDDASVHLSVGNASQTFELDLHPTGSGRYEGVLNVLGEGEFTFKGQARHDGTELGKDAGTFLVGGLNLEFLDTRLNVDLLRQLAKRSGGYYFSGQDVHNLQSALDTLRVLSPSERRTLLSYPLDQWPVTLALVALCLSAEWAIRKRRGMI